MADRIDSLFVDPALLQQAEQLCKQRLKNDPENRGALRSLAEVYRKLGRVAEAAAAFDRLFQLDPEDQEVGYMQALLAGKEWPGAPTGIRAAPFVLLNDFLPQEFHDSLLPFLIAVQEKFVPSLIANSGGRRQYNPDVRDTLDFTEKWNSRLRFRSYFEAMLPPVLPRLQVGPFKIGGVEIHVRAYQDGHFFRVHKDTDALTALPNVANRVVSFVYFFHRVPRRYTGGDLLLIDTNVEANKMTTARFTRIIPEDNSIIIFPSNYYHCVVPVQCPSQEFADSRFVINGFVRQSLATEPSDEVAAKGAETP